MLLKECACARSCGFVRLGFKHAAGTWLGLARPAAAHIALLQLIKYSPAAIVDMTCGLHLSSLELHMSHMIHVGHMLKYVVYIAYIVYNGLYCHTQASQLQRPALNEPLLMLTIMRTTATRHSAN